jgi:hypothetical protein
MGWVEITHVDTKRSGWCCFGFWFEIFLLLFFWEWGLNTGFHACKVGTLPLEQYFQSIFVLIILEKGVSWTVCPGWLQTLTLPVLASQVARITGVSHQHFARLIYFNC